MKLEKLKPLVMKLAKRYCVPIQDVKINNLLRSYFAKYHEPEPWIEFDEDFVRMNSSKVVEVIATHELAHYFIFNHTGRFYRLVRAWLKGTNFKRLKPVILDKKGKKEESYFDDDGCCCSYDKS